MGGFVVARFIGPFVISTIRCPSGPVWAVGNRVSAQPAYVGDELRRYIAPFKKNAGVDSESARAHLKKRCSVASPDATPCAKLESHFYTAQKGATRHREVLLFLVILVEDVLDLKEGMKPVKKFL